MISRDLDTSNFKLSSTIDQTGFSILSTQPWVSVSSQSGTLSGGTTIPITVLVDREALPASGGSAELIINPDNGTGSAIVNVVVAANQESVSRQNDCRIPDVLRVGLPDPGADLVLFPESALMPEQSGVQRRFGIPNGNPLLFDSIVVSEIGAVNIKHIDEGPEHSVMELFELNTENRIVSMAGFGEYQEMNGRAEVDIALLPGVYCYYISDATGEPFADDTVISVQYEFRTTR